MVYAYLSVFILYVNGNIEILSDEKDKLNYQLMNKDFIQFASKSKTVSTMIAEKAMAEDVLSIRDEKPCGVCLG